MHANDPIIQSKIKFCHGEVDYYIILTITPYATVTQLSGSSFVKKHFETGANYSTGPSTSFDYVTVLANYCHRYRAYDTKNGVIIRKSVDL